MLYALLQETHKVWHHIIRLFVCLVSTIMLFVYFCTHTHHICMHYICTHHVLYIWLEFKWPSRPNFMLEALRPSGILTSSFAPFGRSGCMTHAPQGWAHTLDGCACALARIKTWDKDRHGDFRTRKSGSTGWVACSRIIRILKAGFVYFDSTMFSTFLPFLLHWGFIRHPHAWPAHKKNSLMLMLTN